MRGEDVDDPCCYFIVSYLHHRQHFVFHFQLSLSHEYTYGKYAVPTLLNLGILRRGRETAKGEGALRS